MKDNQAKYPQLRFKGFTDPWKQRKLGEEAQLTMGQSPNSENYTKNPDDYILVQGNADMKNGRVVPRVWTTQITKKAEKSDLILSVRAPVGDIGKTDYDVVLGRGVAAIKGNEFIFQQLGKMKLTGYWTRYSTGSTFESINSNDIKDAKIMVPVEEEQQKIGSFFQQLDHLITLQERKYEELKLIKKFLLQNMFADKVPYPNLRFNNFTSEWKLQYLGKLFRRNNERNKKNIFKIDHTITVSKMKFNINGNGAAPTSICTYKVLRTGDVAFEGNRHTKYPFGQLIINDIGDGIMSPRFASIRPKYKLNISYWKYFLHYEPLVHNILVMSTKSGTLMNELVYSDLFKQNIFLPENSEQIKIGKILNIIDYKINLQKRYILKLKSIKNFLLQNMFV